MFALTAIGWIFVAFALLVCSGIGALLIFPDTFGMAVLKIIIRSRYAGVPQIVPAELATWLADPQRLKPLLLDVRRPEEYRVSHLPNARQIDPYSKVADLTVSLPVGQPVVVYCSVGYRSSALADRLIKAGFKNISNLEGSIFAWANEGRPLEHNGEPTNHVHPYGSPYRRLLNNKCHAVLSEAAN